MTFSKKIISGSIKLVSCQNCQSHMSIFVFEGETDLDTVGLFSATLCNSLDIVISELNLEEWEEFSLNKLDRLPSRFESEIEKAGDYRILNILRVEQPPSPPAGISFAEFRKQYQPPNVFYTCPCCKTGECVVTEELTVDDFINAGGSLILLGNIDLH